MDQWSGLMELFELKEEEIDVNEIDMSPFFGTL